MTLSSAIIGYGTLFQTGDTSSPIVWSSLAEVKGLSLPSLQRDVIDAGHESAPDEWREVLTGLKTAGDFGLECNFYKTTYQALIAELGTTTIKPRRIVFPGGSYFQFDAFLVGIDVGVTIGDLITCSVKFRPSGEPTGLTVI
jgi:hypothetical protein